MTRKETNRMEILIAIGVIVAVAIILGVVIAFVSDKFKVKVDERAEKALSMMPGVNCGACGFAGCSGLVDALVDGSETHVKRCAVIKPEKAQEVVDYLNSAEAEDGSKLKVTL
ncbi:MAG: (Fe-S)-binding protein [Bacilli bacterium]|nr:electron transporter RnfB [Bacilli bacterium]MDD7375110.1 (Fe-S)-binding protein [Bacilli bacterium]MDY4156169.1 (Fe-S)-binding protein [Bacilli bacterium]MDY4723689.1 (Fe-S)-binding protein [Bacilli bacterium]